MNDIEFNGETDDEDMEDGETRFDDGSAPVRNIRDPGQPTESERRDCTNTHRPYRSRCKFWVIGSGVNSSLLEVIWKERRCVDGFGFIGEKDSEEQVTPVLVIRDRRHKMTWAMLVPRKLTEFHWIARRAAKFIDQLGQHKVTLRCDNEPAIEALATEIAQARPEGSQTVPQRPPVGESQSNGIIERTVELLAGQARTLKAALEHRTGAKVPPDARILCWLVEFAAYLMNRCDIGTDTQTAWTKGQHTDSGIWKIWYMPAKTSSAEKVGPTTLSWSTRWIVTEQGSAIKTRAANVRRIIESERCDADGILGMRAVRGPQTPVTTRSTFKLAWRDTLRWCHVLVRSLDGGQSSEDVPSQSRLRSVGSQ